MEALVMAEFGTTSGPSGSHMHHVPMNTTTPSSAGASFAPSAGSSWSDSADANTALAELDQGLRCGRIGDQSEAIVRFPRLFAKYPFPILISSSLLKLADVFRQQNSNFLRLCVLRVIEQSERHLDKVSNVDELLKRFVTVLHSNDPTARALTLRYGH
jgi:integrator complex subunit 7